MTLLLSLWGCPAETEREPKPEPETETGTGEQTSETWTDTTAALRDDDGDGVLAVYDCDDQDPEVYPGATERCDGVINDCDAGVGPDDGVALYTPAEGEAIGLDLVGLAGLPVEMELEQGRLELCGGTYFARLTVRGPIEIVGYRGATLDGGSLRQPIIAQGDGVVLRDLTFTGGSSGTHGGAVISLGDELLVERCTFAGNTAEVLGGALYAEGSTTLRDCVFEDNEAGGTGGAVDLEWSLGHTIEGCTFTGNRSADQGGAVYARGDLVVTGSTFEANEGHDLLSIGGGGALTQGRGTLRVEDSAFVANVPSGIYGYEQIVGDTEYEVVRSTFTGHTEGSAIWTWNVAVWVEDSELVDNGPDPCGEGCPDGGAINVDNEDLTVTGGLLQGNRGRNGGAIFAREGTFTLSGVTLAENTARRDGGAVYVADALDDGVVLIEDTLMTDNVAGGAGGAVYVSYGWDHTRLECTSSGGAHGFLRNEASEGGAVYLLGWAEGDGISSQGCDWGTGADDNLGELGEIVLWSDGELAMDADDDATFSCTPAGCPE
jgi:predicted outer membrane repeat protein